jgi:hypothetical protein
MMAVAKISIRALQVLALGLLMACDGEPRPPVTDPSPPIAPQTCGAAGLSALVGRDVQTIDAATLPTNRRIVFANNAGSGRTDPTRLTIQVSQTGRVSAVRCG